MEYQEFLNSLQKRGSKPHHINHCLGSRDAWKWVRKNKWKALGGTPCHQSIYSAIVDTVNKILVEQLLEGHEIEFPHQMGTLKLISAPTKVYVENGELKTNYRTDWKKTLELWYEDEEARNSHKTVKKINSRNYSIKYDKSKARYANRRLYQFRANRSLSKELGRASESRKIIAESVER